MFLSAWNHDYLSVYLLVFLGEELCHYENASVRSSACVCVSVSVAAPAHQRRPCHTVRFMFVCDGRVSKRSDDLTGCSLADWLAAGWIFGCLFVGFWLPLGPPPCRRLQFTVYSAVNWLWWWRFFRLHWSTIKRAAVAYHWHSVVGCLLESNTIAF